MPVTTDFDMAQMRESAGHATQALKALAHEDRLLLLCQLIQEELCVSDLEQQLDIRQPSLSQQLGILRKQGLVETRREGKHIFYRIADEKIQKLLETLYGLYCQ